MKFLIDAQLPPALASWLAATGHEAVHVMDVAMQAADDGAIWDYAVAEGAVIVTKDEDFAARRAVAPQGPAIVWLRIGNCTNEALAQWLDPIWPDVVQRLDSGEVLIEVV